MIFIFIIKLKIVFLGNLKILDKCLIF
jgi:hypothetical protein